MTVATLILALFAGHALCDYPLQSDFVAKGKNPNTAFLGMDWRWIMAAHCLIHAGAVLLITGSLRMALAEYVIHCITDYSKCEGKIGFNTDQAIHYGCKILWAVLVVYGGAR